MTVFIRSTKGKKRSEAVKEQMEEKRKRGGQPGNRNACKQGFYSRILSLSKGRQGGFRLMATVRYSLPKSGYRQRWIPACAGMTTAKTLIWGESGPLLWIRLDSRSGRE